MSSLDGESLLRINQLVERFEGAWRGGDPIPLEDLLLGETDPLIRSELLGYALAVELEGRRRRGELPMVEEYQRRFVDASAAIGFAFEERAIAPIPSGTTADADATPVWSGPGDRPPGRLLGRYEVLGQVGGGGQGSALLAYDPDLGRQVVLKRYHVAGGDIAREAKALCRVRSPHTAQCHDLMRLDDRSFLIMEFIPGRSLAEVLRAGHMAPGTAARLAEQVARGLEAVHACGLLHRDIKPSNVVIGDDGAARLVDFGLAAHLGSVDLDSLSGSPPFMAPEQARRQWERIDARTDLYGVGGLLYAMLTGQPPHAGKTRAEMLEHARRGEVPRPRSLVRSIPRSLERLIMQALAADPSRRHASAADLRRSLRRYRLRHRAAPFLSGIAVLMALLVPTWALWPRAAPPGTDPGPRPGHASSPAEEPGPPRVTRFEISHYPRLDEANFDSSKVGLLGKRSFSTRLDDEVTVQAELSEPAFSYLIAFRPDGTDEVCDPEDEATPPVRKLRPMYPPPSRTDVRYRLSEGAGMHAFALVVARNPLPAYRDWVRRQVPIPWGAGLPCTPGVVWRDDTGGLRPLLAAHTAGTRGMGVPARGSGAPAAKLTDWLHHLPDIEAVALEAFPVEKTTGP